MTSAIIVAEALGGYARVSCTGIQKVCTHIMPTNVNAMVFMTSCVLTRSWLKERCPHSLLFPGIVQGQFEVARTCTAMITRPIENAKVFGKYAIRSVRVSVEADCIKLET